MQLALRILGVCIWLVVTLAAFLVVREVLDAVVGNLVAALAGAILAVGGISLLAANGVILFRAWRPAVEDRPEPELDTVEAVAFREVGSVEDLAAAAGPLFWDQATYVHRRVEHVEFLDRTIVRRKISIDFVVPEQLDDRQVDLEFLPLTVLRNWPPVHRFDLRDAAGTALPLLSKTTTNQLDEQVLRGVAEYATGAKLGDETAQQLAAVVHGEGYAARRALRVFTEALQGWLAEQKEPLDPEPFERLVDLAAVFVDSTLLWVDVSGKRGQRQIVKLAYDEPLRPRLNPLRSLLTAFGLQAVAIDLDAPHVSDAGTYHLQVHAPEGLEFAGAQLVLNTDAPPPGRVQRLRERIERLAAIVEEDLAIALGRRAVAPLVHSARRHVRVLTRRVHFYLAGPRRRSLGLATLVLFPERRGPLTAAAILTGFSAAIMTALDRLGEEIVASKAPGVFGAAIAFLLLGPGLLAYALLRTGEHPFLSRVLAGSRLLCVIAAALPVASAGLLIDEAARPADDPMQHIDTLMHLSWALAAVAILALLVPRRGWNRAD